MSLVATSRPALAECHAVGVVHEDGEVRVEALRAVDLAIAPGESLALLGPSGSGKTSLLHVLGGLLVPSTGSAVWKSRPLSSLDEGARGRARARGIAYVFQGSNLLPHLTVWENLAFAARIAGPDPAGEGDRLLRTLGVRAGGHSESHTPDELLALVGLADRGDSLPSELSGGEAQRVATARALAQRPELLLCDEPTGHLDSDTGRRVLDLIDALTERFGFAVVTATHDPDVAARAERVLELVGGELREI
jgi:putative ABC transport system ATP-binding protein